MKRIFQNLRISASYLVLAIFLAGGLASLLSTHVQAEPLLEREGALLSGALWDSQGQPVVEAELVITVSEGSEPLVSTHSLENGSFSLLIPEPLPSHMTLEIHRLHFENVRMDLDADQLAALKADGIFDLGQIEMTRRITPGFWAAAIIFVVILLLIALEVLHNTSAALTGLSLVFLVHYVIGNINPDFKILDFETSLKYINWEVIFLVMAMMIVVAVIEGTGIFQWMAFQAYRLSRGRTSVLVLILMLITAVASALLDNFTTMLLMTPISLQIGLALGINPLAFIIPEVLASNVGGISTLIGTPTNILIGAHAGISFSDFLVNQTVGVVAALIAMGLFVLWFYRKEWKKHSGGISEALYERLKQNGRLKDPDALWKSLLVFLLVIFGFVIGEQYHIVPAVPALVGATILMVWLKPDVHSTIHAVDWTTLVFFIALFVVVGSVQEVGVMAFAADWMLSVVGDSLVMGIVVIVFGVGTLSTAIANIPLAASMLPIIDFLTVSIPGANSKVFYYALSMGAAMGGNGLLVGAEANLVTAGIASQAGHSISFKEFLRIGLPSTYITLIIGFVWLLIRF